MRSVLLLTLFAVTPGCAPAPKGSAAVPATVAPEPAPARSPREEAAWRTVEGLVLFHPVRFPDGDWRPGRLTFEDVWFDAADGTRLHGWYCPCAAPRAVVLFAHGNGGNLSYCRARLEHLQRELRVTALIFDYRGYGRSEGEPTVEGVLQDARAARSFVAGRAGVKEGQVVLMGHSLGGAVVAHLAGELPPRGLVLEGTFSSLRDVAAHHYPHLAGVVPPEKFNSAACLGRYEGPLLQCHGDADGTIPYALGEKLFRAPRGRKQWVRLPGADHNDPPTAEYQRELGRFIAGLPGG
jgi:pimeloyl-ACP methyl ester carboxylesterase